MRLATVAHALPALVLCAAALLQVACSGGSSGGIAGGTAAQTSGNSTSNSGSPGNSPPPAPSLRVTSTSLPNALQGQPFSQTLQASGGTPPYAWSASATYFPLPPGLSLSASGLLNGTPTGWGNQACFVQVTDSSSPPQTASQVVNFFIIQALSITAPPASAPPSVRHPYSELFLVNGGSGAYAWSVKSGSLPPGLALVSANYNGIISGTPTARGAYNFTVQVSDAGPPAQTATQNVSLTVLDYPEITNNTLPVGLINYPYSAQLLVIGGTPPYTFSLNNPTSLPPGVTFDSATGTLSGTPVSVWNQYPNFTVTDSQVPSLQSSTGFSLTINPVLRFTQSQGALPDAVQDRPYTYPLPFQGGLPPYTITIATGALPAGITVPASSTVPGTFNGSSSATGNSNFTLTIQDSESPNPAVIQQAFSIRVNLPLVITNAPPPPGAVGLPYSFQFQATGGVQPYEWLLGPADGLTMNSSTGLLSGRPTTANSLYLYVAVQDSSSPRQVASFPTPLPIYDQLRSGTSVLPRIAPNVPVNIQLSGFGGTGNYVWSVASGILPNGLSLSSNGELSGTATQTGAFPVTLQLSDAGPPAQTATLTRTITVSGALGRNDTPATATPLSNGTYYASISPFPDPPTGVPNPDSDYYALTANPGATVTIEIKAQRLNPPSSLDSVLEIMDANNNRLSLCDDPLYYPFGPHTSPCLNDDIPNGGTTDSILVLLVPSANSAPLTFYAHVLDWRGDARPDFIYTITVSGAN